MSDKASNITLVILAAGASSRMGTPKQLLSWGNDNLITHAINNALGSNVEEVIVVLGANNDIIFQEISHLPVTIVFNNQWKLGLGSSIASAIDYLNNQEEKPKGVLITLADQPLVTSEHLNELILNFSPGTNQIIATSYSNRKQGVPVLFDSYYFRALLQLDGDFGAKSILVKNQTFVKNINLNFKNIDLDTLEDYKTLHAQNFKPLH
ncbi:NTP transferase domain-containing protein [Aestuariivivens sp. NBU2969]|uniref:nucleotidyltransferase family protein n=1 Tax=Aestuariivivens sp. NBU2969 TaxID=2873267 RepID=UPI001CC029C7|nr:nucleotidyltransferase family protein [Aestuariivivens sp. NBU2969]